MGDPGVIGQAQLAMLLRPLEEADRLVLAVSGGPDSVVLMHLTAQWRGQRARPLVAVATVDHQLRDGSAAEAAAVADWARDLGFEHHTLRWEGEKPTSRLQEAARQARYELLTGLAQKIGARQLVTAHTLDDQAETILFRLARGSGPLGLVGMRPISMRCGVALIRPMLGLSKSWLIGLAKREGWPFFEDPSNRDPRFARTRLRALMPLLAKEGLTAARLARLSARLQEIATLVEGLVRQVHAAALLEASPSRRVYAFAALAEQPKAVLLQVLTIGLSDVSGGPAGAFGPRLERLETMVDRLQIAHRKGERFRQTLMGAAISLESGRLVLVPEPARRRGIVSNRPLCSVGD
jgi:tRNA(Ile)-lysidine synthase